MKVNRVHTGWAVKIWVLATVFMLPFLDPIGVAAWLVLGAGLGLAWKASPEGPPEKPVGSLPYADRYKQNEIPRRDP